MFWMENCLRCVCSVFSPSLSPSLLLGRGDIHSQSQGLSPCGGYLGSLPQASQPLGQAWTREN